jgi:hypothetical protein
MAVADENVATLERLLDAPLVGRIAWHEQIDLQTFARQINLELLA